MDAIDGVVQASENAQMDAVSTARVGTLMKVTMQTVEAARMVGLRVSAPCVPAASPCVPAASLLPILSIKLDQCDKIFMHGTHNQNSCHNSVCNQCYTFMYKLGEVGNPRQMAALCADCITCNEDPTEDGQAMITRRQAENMRPFVVQHHTQFGTEKDYPPRLHRTRYGIK
jgi:hypothetical protein